MTKANGKARAMSLFESLRNILGNEFTLLKSEGSIHLNITGEVKVRQICEVEKTLSQFINGFETPTFFTDRVTYSFEDSENLFSDVAEYFRRSPFFNEGESILYVSDVP